MQKTFLAIAFTLATFSPALWPHLRRLLQRNFLSESATALRCHRNIPSNSTLSRLTGFLKKYHASGPLQPIERSPSL